MKNIDFLPESYRQRKALRRARLWWGIVVVIFGTAIGSAAFAQQLQKRAIQRELKAILPQYAAAQARVQELTRLQAQIAAASRAARLVTWLENPWPRSQILAEIVRPLPEGIRLTEIRILEESVERREQVQVGPRRRGPKAEEEGPKLSPAESDLAQLRQEAGGKQTVVQVAGTTADVSRMHAFIQDLTKSKLFADVHLASIETPTAAASERQTTFSLRILVKPNLGTAEEGSPRPKSPDANLAKGGDRT
jgi:Tfp pilus assembly protein PilN